MRKLSLNPACSIHIYQPNLTTRLNIPFYQTGIKAGFPSPADDFLDLSIDLNKEYINDADATFYGRAEGDSMKGAGISNDDLLIIDKSIEPKNGSIVVCYLDGGHIVKRVKITKDVIWLLSENEKYKPIKVTEGNEFLITGVVTTVIKKV